MAISFDSIPLNLRVPGVYLETTNENANNDLNVYPTKVLLVGQRLGGVATPLVPQLITAKEQGKALFGAGSQLSHMIEAFKNANSFVEVWAIGQSDNAAGVAATGKLSVVGPASAAGTINLYVAGRLVQVGVAAAATAATIATNIAAAINAKTDLPVTAAVDGTNNYEVNLSARHKGVTSNSIDVRVNYYQDEVLPSGVTITITAMSGGTANPDIDDVFAAIGDTWFTAIVCPYTDTSNLVALEGALEDRYGPLKMLDAHGYIAYSGTVAELVTLGQGRNSPFVSAPGLKGSPTPTYEIAAALGAVCAYNLQLDPARPVQHLELPGVLAPKVSDRFTLEERNILLYNGISTFEIMVDGTVQIERVITSYRVNDAGASDESYLNIETMHTLSYIRYDLPTYILQKFPRYKLADDGTNFGVGQAIVTPSIVRDAIIDRFIQWEENGLVEGRQQFKKELIVERSTTDRDRLNSDLPVDIINQFRILATKANFYN